MLHYNTDNEIMSDLYRDFCELRDAGDDALHELGQKYLALSDAYDPGEETLKAIRLLCDFKDEKELSEAETILVHGYVTARADLRREEKEYKEFAMQFDGEEQRAFLGLQEYIVGKQRIPYKIKNKDLTVLVIGTPAMSLELNFENVLIEDGRHPREILITHLAGEKFEEDVTSAGSDGTTEKITKYRMTFINGLTEARYQTNISSFVFSGAKATLNLYNYSAMGAPVDVNADKLPWRCVMSPLDALIEKARVLGAYKLNENEIAALPFLCVFYELIQFYLDPSTQAGMGQNLMQYDSDLAADFAFSQDDLNEACAFLDGTGLDRLKEWLVKANEDRDSFVRFWIGYAASKSGEELYALLMETLSMCGQSYETAPMPLAFEKYSGTVRRLADEYFGMNRWSGSFPHYYMSVPAKFLEVTDVCGKMYSYINEKSKVYYVDFLEGISRQTYGVMAVDGEIILKEDENAGQYCALNGFFCDGGRRRSWVIGEADLDGAMESSEVTGDICAMIEDAAARFSV